MTATAGLVVYFVSRKDPSVPSEQAATATSSEEETYPVEPPPSDPSATRPDPPSSRPEAEPAAWLPPEEQEKVNKAIEKGIAYLEKNQNHAGSWGLRLGLCALPGLTLLECGVPADDSRVQKAVRHVRQVIPRLDKTYDLSLAILFLDRLGDPRDKKLIQTCALRLVAGQSPGGGWVYVCPILTAEEEKKLLTFLQQTRPTSALDLFVQGSDGTSPPGLIAQGPQSSLGKTTSDGSIDSKLLPDDSTSPRDSTPITKKPIDPKTYQKALDRLPANLRKLPALQPPAKAHNLPRSDAADNSNTHFAILGLWAASRHDLPLQRPLALLAQRFRKSAAASGGWGYRYALPTPNGAVTSSMTGVGLLGLAVGLGLAADHASRPRDGGRIEDPAVEKGFKALAGFIGKPLGWKKPRAKNRTQINLYFLWATERVGVLFQRRHIDGKDWYSWGIELLLDHQREDGSWTAAGYPGSSPITDTCFALLFLKRANLAKDLTKKLEFFMEGKKLLGP